VARQDLAYAITVNDAQLRLATQQVAAFNAELAASTVTGRKVDESLRAVGRRASQAGAFFTRNLTVPVLLAGGAAAKYAYDFQKASAKIQGLAGTTEADLNRMNKAVFALASKEATLGPNALEVALFHLRSAGLSTSATIKALKPVSEAAVSGLGDIASVTTAVTSAMDSYGFKNLSAAHAVDVLIETVRKGNIPVQELAATLGRVTAVAAAMHIPFEQVGAAIASITRQMPNANLAVTGLRAILQTFLKDQPQTEKALNAIGASGAGIQESFKKVGLFPTLLALRQQFKGIHVDQKLLEQAYNDGGKSQAKFIASLGTEGEALAKLFPNIRALAAFLIITGSNAKLNANVFAELNATTQHTGQALERAFGAFSKTDAGKLRLALGQLQVDAVKIGPTFIRMASSLLQLGNSAVHLFQSLGPFKNLARDLGIGLLLFGPITSLFGRLTQAVSGGVTIWGRWQEQATLAAYKAQGVDIETAKLIVTSRKAAVQFDEGFTTMTAAANKTTTAVERLNAAVSGVGVRGRIAGATAGNALLTRASGGRGVSRGGAATQDPLLVALPNRQPTSSPSPDDRLAQLQTRREAQLARAEEQTRQAALAVEAAQAKVNLNSAIGASGAANAAAAELQLAKNSYAAAAANEAQARTLQQVIFDDERLIQLTRELNIAQAEQSRLAAAGATISAGRQAEIVAGLEQEITLRQRILAGQDVAAAQNARLANLVVAGGGFAALDKKAKLIQEMKAAGAAGGTAFAAGAKTPMRLVTTNWGTAVEGMKSVARAGFGLIALTFATDVASKIIFDSHKTKEAVQKDWTTIAAILGAGGIALGRNLASSKGLLSTGEEVGGLALLSAKFKQVAADGLSFKAKMALVTAGLLGGQAAGLHLRDSLSVLSEFMLVKGVLSLTSFGKASVALGGDLAISRAGIIGLSIALTDLIANKIGPTEKFFGKLDSFFSKHIDPHVPFIGNWLSQRDAHDAAARLGTVTTSADKAKKALAGLSDFQRQQLAAAHLNQEQAAAVVDLFKHGQDNQAENLINTIEFQQAKTQAAQSIALLKKDGHAAAAKLLEDFVNTAKSTRKEYSQLFSDIQQSLDNAFQAHTDRMLEGFDNKTQSILDKFDAATQKMQDNLKTKVTLKSGETFTIRVNGKTPAERELDALDKIDQKRQSQRDIFDARSALAQATLVGDPGQIRDAERKLQDAQTAQQKIGLQARATAERNAADKAIKKAQDALDQQRKVQRQQIENLRSDQRRNIEATRTILQQNLDNLLKHEATLYSEGKISLKKYQDDVGAIMKKYKITLAQAGKDGGQAYADQLRAQLNQLSKDVDKSVAKIQKTLDAVAQRWKNLSQGIAATNAAQGEQARGNKTGVAAAVGAGTITNPITLTKIAAGIPTRPAIVSALKAMNGGIEYARYGKYVPDAGRPTLDAYTAFLGKISDTGVRTELRSRLRAEGFIRASTGAVVPGAGHTDTVAAMLTPGEIVLNSEQQRNLAERLGMRSFSPSSLFRTLARRYADGGVVSEHGQGMNGPILPRLRIAGLDKLNAALDRLTLTVAQNSTAQQNAVNDPRVINLIRGITSQKNFGPILDARDRPGPEGPGQIAKLMKLLNPVHSTDELRATIPHFDSLPVDQKRQLETTVARMQAHPVLSGLITPTPTGATIGGTGKISLPRNISIASSAFQGGGGITIQNMTIEVNGNDNPDSTARKVAQQFERRANRLVRQRRGSRVGGLLTR
jgi:hypothetical protein